MATKTRRELVDQALKNLGVLPPGVTPSDEEVTTVGGYIEPLVSSLERRDIVSIDPDEIEDEFFLPLAVCLADACKHEYGGGEFDVVSAEQQLRQMNRSGPTYEVLQSTYF